MTDLRGIRESAGLDRPIETPEELKWVAFNYEQGRREVYQRYIAALGTSPQYEFEPEVVLEAVDTYVTLGRGARRDGQLVMSSEDGGKVLDALLYVVKNLPESDGQGHPGGGGWREDRRLRELFLDVGEAVADPRHRMAIDDLKMAIGDSQRQRTRENAALILACFGEPDDTALAILRKMAQDETPGGRWKSALGALGPAKLGDKTGWKGLTQRLQEGNRAYAAALLLAQQRQSGLKQLTEKFGPPPDLKELTARIKNVINCPNDLAACRPFNNCFEERYARYLIACLDRKGDHCEAATTSGQIGGECSLGS